MLGVTGCCLSLRLFSILTMCLVGERGTPFGSGPLQEITFKATLRFIAANGGTRGRVKESPNGVARRALQLDGYHGEGRTIPASMA
jgi:hypothetical protein